jgi:hypothetical protein
MEKYKLGLLLTKYRLVDSHKTRLAVINQLARMSSALAGPAGEVARQILQLDPETPGYGGAMEKLGRVLCRQLAKDYRGMR